MTTTFTIRARTLKDFMEPLLRCAGRDDMLPVLTGVYLRGIGGTLVGTSTDRFRMAFHRHNPEDMHGDDFAVLVPSKAIKNLLAVFRAVRSHNPLLTITVDGEGLSVYDGITSVTVRPMDGMFPDVVHLLRTATKANVDDAAPVFGVNAKFLADIAAGVPSYGNTTAVRAPIGSGAIFFQVTDDLLILVMPRRRDDDDPVKVELDTWIDLLGGAA